MESLGWMSNQNINHYTLEGNSLFLPAMISNGNNNFYNSIEGNTISKDHLTNPIKEDDAFIKDASAISVHHQLQCLRPQITASIEDDEGISMIFSDCNNSLSMNEGRRQAQLVMETADFPIDDDSNSKRRKRSSNDISSSSNLKKPKKPRFSDRAHHQQANKAVPLSSSSNINFQQPSSSGGSSAADHHHHEPDTEAIAQMKEMIYRAAAFRPVDFGLEVAEKPKRKNVRTSNYPQTVAARQRRERISERIRVLQRLVPGGNKMDTASMLDEAANYLKFLRSWVKALESLGQDFGRNNGAVMNGFSSAAMNLDNYNLGFSVPFVNGALAMHNPHQQQQFSVLNPSYSVHPSRS